MITLDDSVVFETESDLAFSSSINGWGNPRRNLIGDNRLETELGIMICFDFFNCLGRLTQRLL